MKNPIEAANRNLNEDSGGNPEKKLTREQRESLLESVDLSKIENYKFHFPLLDCCPKLKTVLGDPEHNPKDGILAMMVGLSPFEPRSKEDIESQEWNYGPAVNKKDLDWDKIEKYGYTNVYLSLRNYLIGTQIELPIENPRPVGPKTYKKFIPISDLPSLLGVGPLDVEGLKKIEHDVEGDKAAMLVALKKILSEQNRLPQDQEIVLKSHNAYLCFELDKEISEEMKKDKKENPLRKPQDIKFEYDGHSFEVKGLSIDNEDGGYGEALNRDNPFYIRRAGAHTECIIDGVDSKSKDLYYVLKWLHKDIVKRQSMF